jgi:hypothetical protein
MKGVDLAGADLSPLAASTSTSGRRRQAIGTTLTDLRDAKMWADVIYGVYVDSTGLEPDEYLDVPIFQHESLTTFLERAGVLFAERMLARSKTRCEAFAIWIPTTYGH